MMKAQRTLLPMARTERAILKANCQVISSSLKPSRSILTEILQIYVHTVYIHIRYGTYCKGTGKQ
jgi:hypothetical protein